MISFLILSSTTLIAQPDLNQQKMQQQMQQMQQVQQQMSQLMERTQAMNQEMNRRMQQLQNESMMNQFQMMHRFNEQMHMTLGTIKNAAERCNLMLQDREMMKDQTMKRDMDQLREHIRSMSSQMGEAVQTMERLTKRLYQQVPETGQ
ncbi:hypothetical protein AB2B38_002620 [Balneola sp. MJW-20]|uniref:hypothetical protein n=1 Tax=Gracilimonas aurantiaca TaxID=3234185 RepID=UPI00390C26C1